MIIKFGDYTLEIDVEKTKHFYESAENVSDGCSCDGCLNFEKAVDSLPGQITSFFEKLGIDMKKACECYVNCKNDDGSLLYGGFYHLCGVVKTGEGAWKRMKDNYFVWNNDATYAVTDNFRVSFQNEVDLLEDPFPLPAMQLEFSASIPWVLNKENTYK